MTQHIAVIYPPHAFSTRDVAVGYSKGFQRMGLHVTEVHYEEIWKKWCDIQDLQKLDSEPDKRWLFERATADVVFEVLKCAPDVAVVIDGTQIHDVFWDWMDRLGVPTAVAMTDCPYNDVANAYVAERCTFPFANDRWSAKKMGIPYLPMAYCKEIHHMMIVPEKYKCDVVFVGSGFPERKALLEAVDWGDVDFRLFGYWELDDDSPLRPYFQQDALILNNIETVQFYAGAKLVLNLDRTSIDFAGSKKICGRGSVGPRIYEAAACGAVIVSQDTVGELYDLLGNHFIPFNDPELLGSLVKIFTQDDLAEMRAEMGRAVNERMKGHSYEDRALEMLRYF